MSARVMLLPYCAPGPVSNPKRWKSKAANVIPICVATGRKAPAVAPSNGDKNAQSDIDLVHATETCKTAVADFESSGSQDDRQRVESAIESLMIQIKIRESLKH
jgi:hypothetical protein